jgi:2OG-Fe(II) oxygenase superfamily
MAASSPQIAYNGRLKPLVDLLSGVRRPGDFYFRSSLVAPMPRLDIVGVGTISFPVPEVQAREIIRVAERAPYGRGERTVVDTTVRKVWQVAPQQIRLSGIAWEETFKTILAQVVKGLGCQHANVNAELYKVLLYDAGGFFVSHRDTEKAEGMFGTLVIVLPSLHSGGEVVVRHAGREVVLDLATTDVSQLNYAAFYADCEHAVRPVADGNRLCLIYNLIQWAGGPNRQKSMHAPDYDKEIASVSKLLGDWVKRTDAPPKVVYLLEHQYSPVGLSFFGLKNADAARGKVLSDAAQRIGCVVHLGIVHIEEEGAAELIYDPDYHRSRWRDFDDDEGENEEGEFEVVEVSDSNRYIDNWVDLCGRPVDFGAIPLGDGELLPEGALDEEEPDEQRVSEATGNEGASFERSYRRAAIVIWDKQRYPEVLLQAGAEAAIPYLRKRIEEASQGSESPEGFESSRQIASLAVLIIDSWAARSHFDIAWRHAGEPTGKRAEMLEVLRSTGDGKLIQRFIEKVIVSQYDGSENKQLAICHSLLEPSKVGQLYSALVEQNMPFFHGACVDLVRRLVAVESCDPIILAANRKISESVVKMLSKINPPEQASTQVDWWRARHDKPPVEASSVASLFDILRHFEAVQLRDTAAATLIAYPETYAPDIVLVPALSDMSQRQRGETADAAFLTLWKCAAEFLLRRSEFPPREPADWAQSVKLDCRCADCRQLQSFAEEPAQRVYRFRVRKDRRQHLHQTIESYQMDMTHQTERKGSPQTLVCTKTRRSFQKRCQQHAEDLGRFKTLIAIVAHLPKELQSLTDRMRQAVCRSP